MRKRIIAEPICENCEECVYVGDGGHLCLEHNEIVMEDWCPTDKYLYCGGKDFIETYALSNQETIEFQKAVACLEEIQQYRAIGTVEQLQKSVKEEDILKFYYIESEDKYVVGQRVDTLYYAEVGKTGLAFYMSRYLPWGEHVVAPDTLWKEHTYPSEPKEIPFFDWLQGFMKKEYGGTIEEFKDLKEKSAAKKPNEIERKRDDYGFIYQIVKCPCCGKLVTDDRECCDCMQKLDWSE